MKAQQQRSAVAGNDVARCEDGLAGRLVKPKPEQRTNFLTNALGGIAARRRIPAHSELFAAGDEACSYYVLLSGAMLVHRPGTPSLAGRGKAAIRFLSTDEPFIFDCDGRHVAHCVAVSGCDLLRIDRRRLERLAVTDLVLRGILNRVHANEIQWFLQAPSPYEGVAQDDQPDPNEMEFVTDLPARRRQHEGTAS